jgi:hypothetical protein
MNLSVQHVSNNFDNGWGFYVDLESLKPILPDGKYYLEPIYEEPYFVADYYYDDDVYEENIYSFDDNEDNDANSKINEFGAYIVRVGSTTIITAFITYVVLFIF